MICRDGGTRLIAAERLQATTMDDAVRTATRVDLARLTGGAPVVVLAPHPDDESLGCGGLIAACCEAGIPVAVVLLTDGAGSHPGSRTHPRAVVAQIRRGEMLAALAALGLHPAVVDALGWPDRHAPSAGPDFDCAVNQLVAVMTRVGACSLVAASGHDPHCDHTAGAAIAAAAAHRLRARHLAYPVWSLVSPPAAMVPVGEALLVDVARYLPAKRRAVACHRSQHGQVIEDDAGFVLPANLLAACLTDHEIYFEQAT